MYLIVPEAPCGTSGHRKRLVVEELVDTVDVSLDGGLNDIGRNAAAGNGICRTVDAQLDNRLTLRVLALGQCLQRVVAQLDVVTAKRIFIARWRSAFSHRPRRF